MPDSLPQPTRSGPLERIVMHQLREVGTAGEGAEYLLCTSHGRYMRPEVLWLPSEPKSETRMTGRAPSIEAENASRRRNTQLATLRVREMMRGKRKARP